nr:MAG TPA: hypothetical protein [Caudoviricetes sp.]
MSRRSRSGSSAISICSIWALLYSSGMMFSISMLCLLSVTLAPSAVARDSIPLSIDLHFLHNRCRIVKRGDFRSNVCDAFLYSLVYGIATRSVVIEHVRLDVKRESILLNSVRGHSIPPYSDVIISPWSKVIVQFVQVIDRFWQRPDTLYVPVS